MWHGNECWTSGGGSVEPTRVTSARCFWGGIRICQRCWVTSPLSLLHAATKANLARCCHVHTFMLVECHSAPQHACCISPWQLPHPYCACTCLSASLPMINVSSEGNLCCLSCCVFPGPGVVLSTEEVPRKLWVNDWVKPPAELKFCLSKMIWTGTPWCLLMLGPWVQLAHHNCQLSSWCLHENGH